MGEGLGGVLKGSKGSKGSRGSKGSKGLSGQPWLAAKETRDQAE